jgi:hypothetical protein
MAKKVDPGKNVRPDWDALCNHAARDRKRRRLGGMPTPSTPVDESYPEHTPSQHIVDTERMWVTTPAGVPPSRRLRRH